MLTMLAEQIRRLPLILSGKFRDDEGATAVEYGMLVALIAAVIVTIVATLGTQILNAFTAISNQLPTP